ncbi:MAG: DUF1294 domain-containing protein [Methanoregulaceae archaeon]|jgi:uncharacterized membrane protein YsdA (DUF1294 family)|nr:DUF1294 domain-containing protein [Methanoregulaceae archaeon]MCU0628646.1 DUF1294 domain-containing protein [Methanoregulaceae archaeon]
MTLSEPLPLFLAIYLFANFSVVLLYGYDKRQAVLSSRRLSERMLLLSAIIAPFGALFGMVMFRHKTRNLKFIILVPVFTALQAMFIVLILIRAMT